MNLSERSSRLASRLAMGIALFGAAYYYLLGGEFTLGDMAKLEDAAAAQSHELADLEARRDSLRARADSLETEPAAIERVAREQHGFIREGEILVRFVDGSVTEAAEPPAEPKG